MLESAFLLYEQGTAALVLKVNERPKHLGLSTEAAGPFSFQYYKWYAGLALFRDQGVSRLEGILP